MGPGHDTLLDGRIDVRDWLPAHVRDVGHLGAPPARDLPLFPGFRVRSGAVRRRYAAGRNGSSRQERPVGVPRDGWSRPRHRRWRPCLVRSPPTTRRGDGVLGMASGLLEQHPRHHCRLRHPPETRREPRLHRAQEEGGRRTPGAAEGGRRARNEERDQESFS